MPESSSSSVFISGNWNGLKVCTPTGGQAGVTYTVSLTIGTQAGRVLARSVLLPVAGLALPLPGGGAILTEAGARIVDAGGNPIVAAS